ncbi:protein FAR-RED ELONGATED HYPOCOTYL 3-like [Primulina huaijiensis]|uniref:protein FAR-RED ELONGATED HYPOCOTYL 3-like n=1 Tax=Primulina huaijiensis TaxID=1492673 RepID=UPI003CC77A58
MRKRHGQASSFVICDMLVENFRGQQKTSQPKSIMTMMRNKRVDITYYKALKSKQLAHDIFRCDPERSFAILPSYLKMVKRMNLGNIIDLVVDEHNRFKYFFLAYGTCERGYRCMRKVVSIDSTWLKGKYNGTLLVVSAQDGDFHQYHLALAVVDVKSIASWSWFFTKLLEVVVDEEELVIISDRHPGIIAAVADLYKNAHHGHCI